MDEKALLVLQMSLGHAVNQSLALGGQGHQHPPAIAWIRHPNDKLPRFQTIHTVRHGSRRDEQRVVQLRGRQPVWRSGTAERGKNVEPTSRQVVGGKYLLDAELEDTGKPRNTSNDTHWGRVQVGPFGRPLFKNRI